MSLQGTQTSSLTITGDGVGSIKLGESAGGTISTQIQDANIFIGAHAGASNTSGNGNAVLGTYAAEKASDVQYSVAVGFKAGQAASRGEYNTWVGAQAGELSQNGFYNTFIGAFAGQESQTGVQNVFTGFRSGQRNVTGDQNTFVGTETGQNNRNGSLNTFVGYWSGRNNAGGNVNTFVGAEAGYFNSQGNSNVFVGFAAGRENREGQRNTFVGLGAGGSNLSGRDNVFIGLQSGASNSTGSYNTLVGSKVAPTHRTGVSNVLIGSGAAPTLQTGSQNLVIGTGADVYSGDTSNSIIVGMQDTRASYGSIVIGYQNDNQKPAALTIGNEIQTNAVNALSIGKGIAVTAGTLFTDPLSTLYASTALREGQSRLGISTIDYDESLTLNEAVFSQPTSNVFNSLESRLTTMVGPNYDLAEALDTLFVSVPAAASNASNITIQVQGSNLNSNILRAYATPTSNVDRIILSSVWPSSNSYNAWGSSARPLDIEVGVLQTRPLITCSLSNYIFENSSNLASVSLAPLLPQILAALSAPGPLYFAVQKAPQYGRINAPLTTPTLSNLLLTSYEPYLSFNQSRQDQFELGILCLETGTSGNAGGFEVGRIQVTVPYLGTPSYALQTPVVGPQEEPFVIQSSYFDVRPALLACNLVISSLVDCEIFANGTVFNNQTIALNAQYSSAAYPVYLAELNALQQQVDSNMRVTARAITGASLDILRLQTENSNLEVAAQQIVDNNFTDLEALASSWNYILLLRNIFTLSAPLTAAIQDLQVSYFDTLSYRILVQLSTLPPLTLETSAGDFAERVELYRSWRQVRNDLENLYTEHQRIYTNYFVRSSVGFPTFAALSPACNLSVSLVSPASSCTVNTNVGPLEFLIYPTHEQAPGSSTLQIARASNDESWRLSVTLQPNLILLASANPDPYVRLTGPGQLELRNPYISNYTTQLVSSYGGTRLGYSNLTLQIAPYRLLRDIHVVGPPTSNASIRFEGQPVAISSNTSLIPITNLEILTIDGVFSNSNIILLDTYDPNEGVYTEFIERTTYTTPTLCLITRKLYNFDGQLYETSFEQTTPLNGVFFTETRSRYYRRLYHVRVETVIEDTQTLEDYILRGGSNQFVNQTIVTSNVQLILTSNITPINTTVSQVLREDISYRITSLTSNIVPVARLDKTHVYPSASSVSGARLYDGLAWFRGDGDVVRLGGGSNRTRFAETSNGPTREIIWHPYRATVLPFPSSNLQRLVLNTEYATSLSTMLSGIPVPSEATHLVIGSLENGIVIQSDNASTHTDTIPLESLVTARYLHMASNQTEEATFYWAFGDPYLTSTAYSAPITQRYEFAVSTSGTPYLTHVNQGLTRNRKTITVPSRSYASEIEDCFVYWTSSNSLAPQASNLHCREEHELAWVPEQPTIWTYELRTSNNALLLGNQSLIITPYEVQEYSDTLEFATQANGTVTYLGAQLFNSSNALETPDIALSQLPYGAFILNATTRQKVLYLEASNLTAGRYIFQSDTSNLGTFAISGHFVAKGGLSSKRTGSVLDQRVLVPTQAIYQSDLAISELGPISYYTGAPLLPAQSSNIIQITAEIDQAGQWAIQIPPSLRGDHPYPLRIYLEEAPTQGAICHTSNGQPITAWYEDTQILYQHRGLHTSNEVFKYYVTTGNFVPGDRGCSVQVTLSFRALPQIQLNERSIFIESVPTSIPVSELYIGSNAAQIFEASFPTWITPGVSSMSLEVSTLPSVPTEVLVPLSVSPSNALQTLYPGIFGAVYPLRINTVGLSNVLTTAPEPRFIRYSFSNASIFTSSMVTVGFKVTFDTMLGPYSLPNPDLFKYDVFELDLRMRLYGSNYLAYEFALDKLDTDLFRFDQSQRILLELRENEVPKFYLNERLILVVRSVLTGLDQIRSIEIYGEPVLLTKTGRWDPEVGGAPLFYTLSQATVVPRLQDFQLLLTPEGIDITAERSINIAIGQKINIQGNNNICVGKNFLTSGNNSIIIGNEIGIDDINNAADVNSIFESILIGSSSFRNTVVRNVIGIGNNNLNNMLLTLTNDQIATFFSKGPIVIGNNIPSRLHEFYVNLGNTFLKGDIGIYLGTDSEKVRIGCSNTTQTVSKAQLYVNGMTETRSAIAAPVQVTVMAIQDPAVTSGSVLVSSGTVRDEDNYLIALLSSSDADPAVIGVAYEPYSLEAPYLWYVATRGFMDLAVPAGATVGSLLVSGSNATTALGSSTVTAATLAKVCSVRNATTGRARCMLML